MKNINVYTKKVMDLVISVVGVLVLSPLFLLIALGIKVTSRGPILFRQQRIGIDGKVFSIYKFRTMIVDAEAKGLGLTIANEQDERITSIGRILRSSSLDELPQLINVVKGDMSLVGPRPPVTYFPYDSYDNYPKWAQKRFKMKPGITGLTQITVRNSVSWDERIKVDNKYIDDFNFFLDLKILLSTFKIILAPKNIYK